MDVKGNIIYIIHLHFMGIPEEILIIWDFSGVKSKANLGMFLYVYKSMQPSFRMYIDCTGCLDSMESNEFLDLHFRKDMLIICFNIKGNKSVKSFRCSSIFHIFVWG